MSDQPKQYHIWITTILSSYEKAIIHGLVLKGYDVSAAALDGSISCSTKDSVSVLIGLKIVKENAVHTTIITDIQNIFDANNMKYYSIVASEFSHYCAWVGTNILVSSQTITEKQIDKKVN